MFKIAFLHKRILLFVLILILLCPHSFFVMPFFATRGFDQMFVIIGLSYVGFPFFYYRIRI